MSDYCEYCQAYGYICECEIKDECMSEQGETDQEKDLKLRGFDYIRGGNSAAYILKHFNDFEKESGKKILKISDLEKKLTEANLLIEIYIKSETDRETKLALAVGELKFYGNTDNWDETPNRNNLYQIIKHDVSDDFEDGLRFGGQRARAALKQLA